jgi:hypothetical protein
MKNIFTLTTLFTLAILVFSSNVFAGQSSKIYKGYVINNAGEKLEGTIQMLSPSLNEIKVKFIDSNNEKKTYKAKEVKEYAFKVEKWNKETRSHVEEWIFYTRKNVERSPIPFGPTTVLVERPVSGTISMYNHFVEQNATAEEPFIHVIYVEKQNNELINITKANYKKVLRELTTDYPVIHNRIGTKGNGFKHISRIIAAYNDAVSTRGTAMSME